MNLLDDTNVTLLSVFSLVKFCGNSFDYVCLLLVETRGLVLRSRDECRCHCSLFWNILKIVKERGSFSNRFDLGGHSTVATSGKSHYIL